MERKGRLGIVTNKMSDDVYKHLDTKSKCNQLSQYIISLVEKDIQESSIKTQFNVVRDELSFIQSALVEMKQTIGVSPIPTYRSQYSLINERIVSDDNVNQAGFHESVDIDF